MSSATKAPAAAAAAAPRAPAPKPGTKTVLLPEMMNYRHGPGDKVNPQRSGKAMFAELAQWDPLEHKTVHYFNEAMMLFKATLESDYHAQQAGKRELKQFTWKNQGELAENFAVLCDQMKKLHAALPDNKKPNFKDFGREFVLYLLEDGVVPSNLLKAEKYLTKLKDWETGGTRYNTDNESAVKSNVKFAGAHQREQKLETWIKKKQVLPVKSERIVSQPAAAAAATAPPQATAAAPAGGNAPQAVRSSGGAPTPAPKQAVPVIPRASGPTTASTSNFSDALKGLRQIPQSVPITSGIDSAMQLHNVRTKVQVLIGENGFPLAKDGKVSAELMTKFAKICADAETVADSRVHIYLLNVVAKCVHRSIHQAFEDVGGLISVCRWVERAKRAHNKDHLFRLIESFLMLRSSLGHEATRAAWLRVPEEAAKKKPPAGAEANVSTQQQQQADLSWLLDGSKNDQYLTRIVADMERRFALRNIRKREREDAMSEDIAHNDLRFQIFLPPQLTSRPLQCHLEREPVFPPSDQALLEHWKPSKPPTPYELFCGKVPFPEAQFVPTIRVQL